MHVSTTMTGAREAPPRGRTMTLLSPKPEPMT